MFSKIDYFHKRLLLIPLEKSVCNSISIINTLCKFIYYNYAFYLCQFINIDLFIETLSDICYLNIRKIVFMIIL